MHVIMLILSLQSTKDLLGLFYHESCRVYQDRLVSDEDRNWFENLLAQKMETDFGMKMEEVVTQQPYLFGDFLSPNVDNRPYLLMEDHDKVSCCPALLSASVRARSVRTVRRWVTVMVSCQRPHCFQ